MQYEIKGGAFPVVICQLNDGEQMITEKGSMVWMSPNMEMKTSGGGVGKMFSKAFSGESMFQNIYTARGGNALIAFGSSFPGQILALEIGPGNEIILQKAAFLASEPGVQLSMHFNKKLGAGFFGGEGFIMQKLSGRGMAFAEVDGELVEYTLGPGQQMIVDTGNVLGFERTVAIDIQQVKGLKNKFFGGEGFFNTVLTGPGKIWLQTMPISGVAMSIPSCPPRATAEFSALNFPQNPNDPNECFRSELSQRTQMIPDPQTQIPQTQRSAEVYARSLSRCRAGLGPAGA